MTAGSGNVTGYSAGSPETGHVEIESAVTVNPRCAQPYHLEVNVQPINIQPCHVTSVPINSYHLGNDLLAKHQGRKGLLGLAAIGLLSLWGIDLCQPDLKLPVIDREKSDSIAVSNAENLAAW